eukprot:m.63048 g.63048  ORF g.63048 m.63048 type:complete len:223 (-) comp15823_c0_seq10:96-764(-)
MAKSAHTKEKKGLSSHSVGNENAVTALTYSSSSSVHKVMLVVLLATAFYAHKSFCAVQFENDRFFSMLTEVERELSLQSEQAHYYSYYKQFVHQLKARPESSFFTAAANATADLLWDTTTEYPDTINVIERFTIYPEIATAILYETYDTVVHRWLGWKTKECYSVFSEVRVPRERGTSTSVCDNIAWTRAGTTLHTLHYQRPIPNVERSRPENYHVKQHSIP